VEQKVFAEMTIRVSSSYQGNLKFRPQKILVNPKAGDKQKKIAYFSRAFYGLYPEPFGSTIHDKLRPIFI